MTDNRTTELREKLDKLGIKHLDSDLPYNKQTRWNRGAGGWGACYVEITHGSILPADSIIDNCTLRIYDCTPEQAIAATLRSDASAVRLAERLRSIAYEMRSVGASSMTPHELLACYANDVEKVADSLMFAATRREGDSGLIADVVAPVCVDEKERRAFERGKVYERFAQQIFKEATS